MASEDNLVGFFFYVLFVYPAVSWVLKPGRFSARKGLTYAILLLVGGLPALQAASIVIGALVLLTLFIGVVTTGMEEATEDMKTAQEVDKNVAEIQLAEGLSEDTAQPATRGLDEAFNKPSGQEGEIRAAGGVTSL